jgi:hypothetical protein
MSQRSRIQRLPGIIAGNRHTRTHPRPASLFQSMLRQIPETRLYIGLIVLCLMCTQLVACTYSTIPNTLANITITSSHFSSNSFLYPNDRGKKRRRYDPAAFDAIPDRLSFTWGDPPPASQALTLSNQDSNPEDVDPIPWYVVIRTVNGIHWLHVDRSHGEIEAANQIDVNVSVKNKNLPPGIYEGKVVFIAPGNPGHPTHIVTIPVCFNIPGPTNAGSCP